MKHNKVLYLYKSTAFSGTGTTEIFYIEFILIRPSFIKNADTILAPNWPQTPVMKLFLTIGLKFCSTFCSDTNRKSKFKSVISYNFYVYRTVKHFIHSVPLYSVSRNMQITSTLKFTL